jgi:kinetochore protein Spc7/SPC105
MQEQTTELLPELEAKLAALQEELVKEREAVKEIEACDVDELNDLRAAIADQECVISPFSCRCCVPSKGAVRLDCAALC